MLPRSLWALALPLAACASDPAPAAPWQPGVIVATPRAANARGLLDRRGLIHAHSVYSHDACDNEPVKDGVRDPVCFDDFRRGLCQSKHDFVMLTDHPDSFQHVDFEDDLLFRAERGDAKVEREGRAVANRGACEGAEPVLILPGMESDIMPVGLERHLFPEPERGYYGDTSSSAIALFKQAGAVALVAHTEGWTPDQLVSLPLDGFEMYNLHANTVIGAGVALELLVMVNESRPGLPHPDLAILPIWSEDPRYLETWGSVLARGAHRVTTMGTDCHRNTFPALLPDGERIDSYRRMMILFSNHLLVRPEADGAWDDRQLKDALRAGRLYGSLDALGYPEGFDSTAEAGGRVFEMGETVPLASAPTLVVKRPSIVGLAAAEHPTITLRLLEAREGGFDEVASTTTGDLRFSPTRPGAYRAEVRMRPTHLAPFLGEMARRVVATDYAWIYANPIYVE